jgi:hypothetical protein
MPKTLVLLLSDDPALAARARRVADGAREVRFAEVDVRRAGADHGGAHGAPPLLGAADYDAVVLGAADADAAGASALLEHFDPGRALADRVGGAFGPTSDAADAATWAALRALAAHGLLLVPPSAGGAEHAADADGRLGRRVATAAGWVRHARGHDHHAQGHAHAHGSDHAHGHAHGSDHVHGHAHDHAHGERPGHRHAHPHDGGDGPA